MEEKICWTIELEQEFIKLWNNMSIRKMAEHFNTTRYIIKNKAKELNLEERKSDKWTKEEERLLVKYSKKYLAKEISEKLGRSYEGVRQHAKKMGIELKFVTDPWEKWMIDYLKENINKKLIGEIEEVIGLNYYQITKKCEELGLDYLTKDWSEEEIAILKDYAPKYHYTELVKVLPRRTPEAIFTKANKLGITIISDKYKLTDNDIDYIKNNWGKITIRQIALDLNIPVAVVNRYKDELNLPNVGYSKKWTDKKIEKLRNLAKEKTADELAEYFKTTKSSIYTVANRNGIELIHGKIKWTEEKVKLLEELSKTHDIQEIAKIMNLRPAVIRSFAHRKNIKLIPSKKYVQSQWTEEDTNNLIHLVSQGKTLIEIATIMNKKDKTISQKARELGLSINVSERKDWSKEEIEDFINCAKTMKLEELVIKFNRTTSSIQSQAKKLNIKIITDKRNWTEEEIKLLEKLVEDKKNIKEIAEILGRSEDAIFLKINRQGLVLENNRKSWTNEDDELLQDLWGQVTVENIAKKLNRTVSAIKKRAVDLGLGSSIQNNYEGLIIQEICNLFNISKTVVELYWIPLGLKYKTRKISKQTSYRYVEIKDLFDFLEANQNIWDSRNLEENILGKEPDWLKEKRKKDINNPEIVRLELMKQQLILANQYYLKTGESVCESKKDVQEEQGFQKTIVK